uniref:Uncharacterized protein n=1 Tax=Plectus sambesii TaxID=2011161 RepID=A0A914W3E3_9BILA
AGGQQQGGGGWYDTDL